MWVFDPSKDDLRTVMRDHHAICMRFVWEKGEEGVTTAKAWLHVNKILRNREQSISRASIINFLNDMVDKGIFTFIERTGKGGYHRVYFPAFDEEGLKRSIADEMISKLLEMWPEEARAVLVEKLS